MPKKKKNYNEDESFLRSDVDVAGKFGELSDEIDSEVPDETLETSERPDIDVVETEEAAAEIPTGGEMVHTPAEMPGLQGMDVGERFTMEITEKDGDSYTLAMVEEEIEEEVPTETPELPELPIGAV